MCELSSSYPFLLIIALPLSWGLIIHKLKMNPGHIKYYKDRMFPSLSWPSIWESWSSPFLRLRIDKDQIMLLFLPLPIHDQSSRTFISSYLIGVADFLWLAKPVCLTKPSIQSVEEFLSILGGISTCVPLIMFPWIPEKNSSFLPKLCLGPVLPKARNFPRCS